MPLRFRPLEQGLEQRALTITLTYFAGIEKRYRELQTQRQIHKQQRAEGQNIKHVDKTCSRLTTEEHAPPAPQWAHISDARGCVAGGAYNIPMPRAP